MVYNVVKNRISVKNGGCRLERLKNNFQRLASIVLTVLAFVLTVALVASFVLLASGSSIEKFFVLGLCFASVITLNVYLLYTLKKGRIANIPAFQVVLMIYNNVIFVSSLVPLFVFGVEQSEADVKAVITNIYVFYGVALVLMLIGLLLTISLIKDSIKKSNWWVFVASLPYIVTSWVMYRDYTGFNQFVHADNFSYKNVAKMLEDIDANMLLLNPGLYKFISILIIVLALMMGMIAVEVVWKKTSEWRQRRC